MNESQLVAPALRIRSNGDLALWIWSGNTGDFGHDFQNYSIIASCFELDRFHPSVLSGVWELGIHRVQAPRPLQ